MVCARIRCHSAAQWPAKDGVIIAGFKVSAFRHAVDQIREVIAIDCDGRGGGVARLARGSIAITRWMLIVVLHANLTSAKY